MYERKGEWDQNEETREVGEGEGEGEGEGRKCRWCCECGARGLSKVGA
jgi:hypothetical protein